MLRPARLINVNARQFRFYSIPTHSTTTSHKPNIPLPPLKNQKPRLDLRPAPLKPPPVTPIRKPIIQSPSTEKVSVKEATKQDIQQAEAHGILTPPPADANWFKRTLHQAIQLAKFYYRGVKLIFSRRKDIALIRARINAGGSSLTRAEYRLIRTQKDDINKVIPFLIIAVLLEEVIPLIALYAPFMLPSTCILPSQRERIDSKRAEKAISLATTYKHVFAALRRIENPTGYLPLEALRTQGASTAVCGLLGLSTIGFDFLRIRRIRNHLEFIARDDQLLLQDSTPLSIRELTDALQERAMWSTQGVSYKDLKARLTWWLDTVKDNSSDPTSELALARRLALLISRY